MGQVQNEEHLCLIAVIGVERPNKATMERELEKRDGVETRAHDLRSRETARANAESEHWDDRESWCSEEAQSAHLFKFIC